MHAYHRCSRFSWSIIVAVAVSALLPGLAYAQEHRVVGCYDLVLAPWTPPRSLGADSIYIAPPPRIYLDSLPAEDPSREVWAVRPAPGSPPSVHRFAGWQWVTEDSIRINWSTGFSGLWMKLAPGEEGLHGHAKTAWDFPREPQTAEVVARRVPCSAPAREEWASYPRFPREVRLKSGRSVVLGQAWSDSGLPSEPDPSVVREEPVGVFAGATGVRVRRGPDGVVRRIEVHFPPDSDFQRLVERFAASFGPPVWRSETEGSRMVSWSGRDSSVSLLRSRLVGGGYEVRSVLTDPRH